MLVLAQTAPDQAEGIRTRVDRNLVSREQVGKGTDVVLVSVGEHHAVQLAAGLEIGEIGNDDVDAQMFFAMRFIPNSPRPPRATNRSWLGWDKRSSLRPGGRAPA
jgi:hypothetical protein